MVIKISIDSFGQTIKSFCNESKLSLKSETLITKIPTFANNRQFWSKNIKIPQEFKLSLKIQNLDKHIICQVYEFLTLIQATQLVQGGIADCTLALGFEKMQPGSLSSHFDDRTNPLEKHATAMFEKADFAPAPVAAQFFGNAGKEHMDKYGTQQRHFTKIAAKNKRHSVNNPFSQFRIDAVFYSTDRLLYHKFGNMVRFLSGNLYSLCSPGNQHYQKIIYFFHQERSKSAIQVR